MTVIDIELINFRLHKNTFLSFSENLNFIVGGNGQGKTSILESIYYLGTTKNLLQSLDSEVVNFGEKFFKVTGNINSITNNNAVAYYDTNTNKKSYFLDGKQVTKSASVIGKFPLVTITPSDHLITQGSPADRRKFVDSVISQTSETYLNILLDYNKTLRQRSSLLTQISERQDKELLRQLDVWSENLVVYGSEIIKHRYMFIEKFKDYIFSAYNNLLEGNENPSIKYVSYGSFDINKIQTEFFELLTKRRNDELRRCTNLVGPHRDDFMFSINDLELRKYGSQGQHKTFQVALKFGQFFYIKDKQNISPVFLMDDIFGELDTYRAFNISKYLKNIGQAFITLTDFANIEKLEAGSNANVFNIKGGMVV